MTDYGWVERLTGLDVVEATPAHAGRPETFVLSDGTQHFVDGNLIARLAVHGVAPPWPWAQFEHDCPECIFLGRYDHNGKAADLYAHERSAGFTHQGYAEYLMRLSSEGSDYWCTTDYGDADSARHVERMPMMAEAKRRHLAQKERVE